MDESNVDFFEMETLDTIVNLLKESEGIKQSKENCRQLLAHASNLKKNIVRIVSEIDKCCQQVSNVALKKQFHEAKGKLLTKSGEFTLLFGEITNISGDVIIDGDLLMSFVTDFEDLVEHFKDILVMHEELVIEMATVHINKISDLLDKLHTIKMPDNLEASFVCFCTEIANLSPLLNKLGRIIVDDPRSITIDATYLELKYMCSPLSRALTMSIFHPTDKPMKDQKIIICRRVSSILMRLRSKLKLSEVNQRVSVGYFTQYVNRVTSLLDQFRNRSISEPSIFVEKLQFYLVEIIKYAAVISYCPKQYEECNAMAQSQLILRKIGTLPQSLAALHSGEPTERVNYFGFCNSYEILLKRIECSYANQVLEYYSDPLLPIKDLISSISECSLDDTSSVRRYALQCNIYSDNLLTIGRFVIAKTTSNKAKILIQLSNTFEWLDSLMLSNSLSACESGSNFLKLKIYARIWGDCAIKFCSALDEMLDTRALIHIAVLKFKEICDYLSLITGESQAEINIAKGEIIKAAKVANHLLLIQQVNPFYNGSQRHSFTKALRNLSSASNTWDGSAIKMLEAVSNIEQIQGSLQLMDHFEEDGPSLDNESYSYISPTNFCQTSLKTEDSLSRVSGPCSVNNTSIDLTCFLNSPSVNSSSVSNSRKNTIDNQEATVGVKSVTKRNMVNANKQFTTGIKSKIV